MGSIHIYNFGDLITIYDNPIRKKRENSYYLPEKSLPKVTFPSFQNAIYM